MDEPRDKRVPFMMSESELKAVDTWRFANHIPTRADAIRRLCQIGLATDERAAELRERARRSREIAFDLFENILDPEIEVTIPWVVETVSANVEQISALMLYIEEMVEATGVLKSEPAVAKAIEQAKLAAEEVRKAREQYEGGIARLRESALHDEPVEPPKRIGKDKK